MVDKQLLRKIAIIYGIGFSLLPIAVFLIFFSGYWLGLWSHNGFWSLINYPVSTVYPLIFAFVLVIVPLLNSWNWWRFYNNSRQFHPLATSLVLLAPPLIYAYILSAFAYSGQPSHYTENYAAIQLLLNSIWVFLVLSIPFLINLAFTYLAKTSYFNNTSRK